MAREHARVKLSIWDDDDFRALSPAAQHLYFVLTIHPTLSYCGVADWRPSRLTGFASGWTVEAIETAAKELAADLYIVIDEEKEEVLLRSFIRNDELMEQPNLAVAMRKAHRSISSPTLRGIVIHELIRLHHDKPDLKGWAKVSEMLAWPSVDPSANPSRKASVTPSVDPSVKGETNPSGNPSVQPSPTTAPNSLLPTPNSKEPRKRRTQIADDWKPSPRDIEWQRGEGIPDAVARRELPRFVDHYVSKGDVRADWSASWRNWLRRTSEYTPRPASPTTTASGEFTGGINTWTPPAEVTP